MESNAGGNDLLFDMQYEIHELFVRTMDGMLGSEGLTLLQFYVLKSLKDSERMFKMSDLAELRLLRPAALTGIADKLVSLGYVERHSDENDRRIVILTLTARAATLINSLENKVKVMMGKFLGRISAEDRATFERVIVEFADFLKAELSLLKVN
jgi:DNA-binding MarR family transcriptional regulator